MNKMLTIKGKQLFSKLIGKNGSYYTPVQFLSLLSISKKELNEMVSNKHIIRISSDDGDYYPCFQIDKNQILDDFSYILSLLSVEHFVDQCQFFLATDTDFNNKPLIEALKNKNNVKLIERKAKQFHLHGCL